FETVNPTSPKRPCAEQPVVDVPAVKTPSEDPWVEEVFRMATPILGRRPQPRAATYFTDANALPPAYGGIPTLVLGPGEMALAHQTDEYCEVDRIGQAVEMYIQIARRWCKL